MQVKQGERPKVSRQGSQQRTTAAKGADGPPRGKLLGIVLLSIEILVVYKRILISWLYEMITT